MNTETLYDAVSGMDESYLAAAADTEAIRRSYKRNRARKLKTAGAVCCAALVIAAAWIGGKNLFGKIPTVTPGSPTAQTDETGEPGETESIPGIVPPATEPSDETEAPPDETLTPPEDSTAPEAPAEPESSTAPQEPVQTSPGTEDSTEGSAMVNWNGKLLGYTLWSLLQTNTDGKTLEIAAYPQPNKTAVYNGKTLAAYDAAAEEEREMPEKLTQLLKLGDDLKYGEALCETGTPEGELWARDLYNERVAYFGEELLNRYIVDGEFLADELKAEIERARTEHTAQDTYEQACTACVQALLAQAKDEYTAQGTESEIDGSRLLIKAVAETFAALVPTQSGEWYITLAQDGGPDDTVEC